MKKCKCCGHEMLGNGDSDFCQSCEAYLSVPANLDAWLNRGASVQPTAQQCDFTDCNEPVHSMLCKVHYYGLCSA